MTEPFTFEKPGAGPSGRDLLSVGKWYDLAILRMDDECACMQARRHQRQIDAVDIDLPETQCGQQVFGFDANVPRKSIDKVGVARRWRDERFASGGERE